jgi:Protein kinase domain/Concanavalin A-like lectin/glucanases superfamily
VVIPDHQLVCLISRGSYGEVWLARNSLGTHRAVKLVFSARFSDQRPFARELSGVQKFEPVSRLHENLVDVLQVGRNEAQGYFYCVMELADDASGAPAIDPSSYRPRTLASELADSKRLPISRCLEIGIGIASALAFLHARGLIHRDVKPSNIIFINGIPKLADIGLVTELSEARSYVGTEGFIPPEGPGTVQSDLYSLGKVLYELSTGKDRHDFPALPSFLGNPALDQQALELNKIILRACRADPSRRYRSASRMRTDLLAMQAGKSIPGEIRTGLWAGVGLSSMLLVSGVLVLVHLSTGRPVLRTQSNKSKLLESRLARVPGLRGFWCGDENGLDALHPERSVTLNRVQLVPGKDGTAFSFSANKGFIEVADAPFLRLTNALTIEFWIKRVQTSVADFVVEKGGDWISEDLDYSVAIDGEDSGDCLMFGFACGCRMAGGITDFNWHHCAVVAREGEADPDIYIDGAEQPIIYRRGDSRIHLAASRMPLHLGAQIDVVNGQNYFSPKLINEVAIYNRALSAAEIQLLASSCREGLMPPALIGEAPKPNLAHPGLTPGFAPAGLVSWWRAEGDARDSVGTNHGVLIGAAGFGPGRVGEGFHLNGAGSYVRIPPSATLNLSRQFTLELWFRNESSIPYNFGLIAKRGSEDAPINYNLCVGPRGITAAYNDPLVEGGDAPLSSFECSIYPVWPEPFVWHHLAATFRQADTNTVEVKTFLDGRLVRTKSLPGSLARSVNHYPVTLGADAEYPTYDFFEGTLDEVRLYRRALSSSEIRKLYHQMGAQLAHVPLNLEK